MDSVENIKDSATQLRELALIAGSIPLACKLLNIASRLEESAKNIDDRNYKMLLRCGGGGGGTWV